MLVSSERTDDREERETHEQGAENACSLQYPMRLAVEYSDLSLEGPIGLIRSAVFDARNENTQRDSLRSTRPSSWLRSSSQRCGVLCSAILEETVRSYLGTFARTKEALMTPTFRAVGLAFVVGMLAITASCSSAARRPQFADPPKGAACGWRDRDSLSCRMRVRRRSPRRLQSEEGRRRTARDLQTRAQARRQLWTARAVRPHRSPMALLELRSHQGGPGCRGEPLLLRDPIRAPANGAWLCINRGRHPNAVA
jgi:hypothetical protein